MNKVWIFGDSFSMDFNKDNTQWCLDYVKYKNTCVKNYGKFIAETFNYKCENFAVGGYDNYSIFETVCDNIDFIKDFDIVIIGWGPYTRYRIVNSQDSWTPVSGIFNENFNDLSKNTLNEFLIHRNHILFEQEVKKWENLIKNKMHNNFIYFWNWSFDVDRVNYETVELDTKGLIKNGHWSENGHKEFSKKIIEKINVWKENC